MKNVIEKVIERAGQALDRFSDQTGIVLVEDWLKHPDVPDVVTLKNLPGYRQTNTYSCGFTAAAMVVHHFYPRRSINRLYQLVQPDEEMGTSSAKLIGALRKSGIAVQEREDLKWTDLQQAIQMGRPVIASVSTRSADVLHWVVLYGYGRRPSRVFVAGHGIPWLGKKEFTYFEFRAAMWNPEGYALICRKSVRAQRK